MGCVMKYLIPVILFFAVCFKVQAGPMSDLGDEFEDKRMTLEEMVQDMILSVVSACIDCEGDDLCIIEKYEAFQAGGKNQLLKEVVTEILDKNKEQIAWFKANPEMCRVDEVKAYKQVTVDCLKPQRDNLKAGKSFSDKEYGLCLVTGMFELVDKDNIYALAFLTKFFEQVDPEDAGPKFRRVYDLIASTLSSADKDRVENCITNWQ